MNPFAPGRSAPPSTPLHIAPLVTRHLAPVLGVVFLGWSAPNLLLLFAVDFLLSLASVLVLVMAHVTGMGEGKGLPSGLGDWWKVGAGTVLATAIVGLPLAAPILFLLDGFGWTLETSLADRNFLYGLLFQVVASGQGLLQAHRELQRRDDDEAVLKRRTQFIFARWVVVLMGSTVGLIALLGPHFGGAIMVLLHAGTSVYFELFPDKAEALLHGKEKAGRTASAAPLPDRRRRKGKPRH